MDSATKTYGIQEIWRPTGVEPEVDIVAVHGLNGDARKTWTAKKSGICWLNHPDFLPRFVKNARVLVWGYNASFSTLVGSEPSKDRVHHHAQTLVANLSANRRLCQMTNRPIIFLCHSLGGVIVKRALCYSETRRGSRISHEYNIFASTYGILFFGTPHMGSSKATWLGYLQRVSSMFKKPMSPAGSGSDLVAALEHQSETLQNINDFFVPLMKNFSIYFFWEQEKTDLHGMGRDYIVNTDSAAPTYDETERAGIAATHSGMVKFETPSDQGFLMVAEALLRYCEDAPVDGRRRRVYAEQRLDWERHREAVEAMQKLGTHGSQPSLADDQGASFRGFGHDQLKQQQQYPWRVAHPADSISSLGN